MPLYRFPPGMSQESLQRRGLVERALIVILLVLSQHTFDIISLFFGGLSVYFICAGIPSKYQSRYTELRCMTADGSLTYTMKSAPGNLRSAALVS